MDEEQKTELNNNSTEPISSTLSPEDLARSAFQKDTAPTNFAQIAPDAHKRTKNHRKFSLKNLSKKQKIIILILTIVGAVMAFAGWWFLLKAEPATQQAAVEAEQQPPAPTTVASRVTGLQVEPEINERHVTGVMIENSPDARPQSGLREADVVYEAIAEAGITRFLAIYQDTEPKYIGPVRSARPYYLDFLLPYDAGYAHVGGSPDALKQIKQLKVKDLDQFANSGAYERVSSRYAPHNVYTSLAKLDAVEKSKDYKTSDTTGFVRKADETPSSNVTAKTINFNISSTLYNVQFKYDKKSNKYMRNMAGKPHKDEKSGKQIASKVVIALVMKKGYLSDGYHTKYTATGKGTAYIFQDGEVVKGTWQKDDRDKQFKFVKTDGTELQLNPGKTWVTIVSEPSSVSYKP